MSRFILPLPRGRFWNTGPSTQKSLQLLLQGARTHRRVFHGCSRVWKRLQSSGNVRLTSRLWRGEGPLRCMGPNVNEDPSAANNGLPARPIRSLFPLKLLWAKLPEASSRWCLAGTPMDQRLEHCVSTGEIYEVHNTLGIPKSTICVPSSTSSATVKVWEDLEKLSWKSMSSWLVSVVMKSSLIISHHDVSDALFLQLGIPHLYHHSSGFPASSDESSESRFSLWGVWFRSWGCL